MYPNPFLFPRVNIRRQKIWPKETTMSTKEKVGTTLVEKVEGAEKKVVGVGATKEEKKVGGVVGKIIRFDEPDPCEKILKMETIPAATILATRAKIGAEFKSYLAAQDGPDNSKGRVEVAQWLPEDIHAAVRLYDKYFFGETLLAELTRRKILLEFKYDPSCRNTRRGGYYQAPTAKNPNHVIMISYYILNSLWGTYGSPTPPSSFSPSPPLAVAGGMGQERSSEAPPPSYESGGVECKNAIEVLQLILEHELFHLIIGIFAPHILTTKSTTTKSARKKSKTSAGGSSTAPRRNIHGVEFKTMVKKCFGHTKSTHALNMTIDAAQERKEKRQVVMTERKVKCKEVLGSGEFVVGTVVTFDRPPKGYSTTDEFKIVKIKRVNVEVSSLVRTSYGKRFLSNAFLLKKKV